MIAAIATPITPDGLPDAARFVALARHLLDNGCDGLNVLGTTGEATSFTVDQRMGLMTAAARAGLPLDRLMVGTGAAAIGDSCRLTEHAEALGFAGTLLLLQGRDTRGGARLRRAGRSGGAAGAALPLPHPGAVRRALRGGARRASARRVRRAHRRAEGTRRATSAMPARSRPCGRWTASASFPRTRRR